MTVFPVFSLGIGSADHCFYLVQNDRISTLSLDGQPPDSLLKLFSDFRYFLLHHYRLADILRVWDE